MRLKLYAAACCGLSLFTALPAQATITETIGGPGGRPFTLAYPPSEVIVGLSARAGAWIDGFTVLCASARRGSREPAQWIGGQASLPQEVYCPSNTWVTGLAITFTRGQGLEREYINSIGMSCGADLLDYACIKSGDDPCHARTYEPPGLGTQLKRLIEADRLVCPSGEVALSLTGRAAAYVDAIAMICGPNPLRAAAAGLHQERDTAHIPGPPTVPTSTNARDVVGERAGQPKLPTSRSPAGHSAPRQGSKGDRD